jgi:hypothetical protein
MEGRGNPGRPRRYLQYLRGIGGGAMGLPIGGLAGSIVWACTLQYCTTALSEECDLLSICGLLQGTCVYILGSLPGPRTARMPIAVVLSILGVRPGPLYARTSQLRW